MAEWELTNKLGQYLDRHLVFPLLEFLSTNHIYNEDELLQVKLGLLNNTNMVDFAIDVWQQLNPDQIPPDQFMENRIKVVKQLKELESVTRPILELLTNEAISQEIAKARDVRQLLDHLVDFTAEEGYGKFLDLNECYLKYRNLKGVERIDYLSYLSEFDNLSGIPKDRKMTVDYKKYLESLLGYLMDYCSRVMPLLDLEEQKKQVSDEFEKQWESGTFPGWPKETSSALIHSGAQLDLSSFSSAAELASLGLDRLKTALMALNLKCGGTLEERTNRLWATKKKTLDELNPNLFAKIKSNKDLIKKKQKELGFLEAQIHSFAEILENQRIQTKENVTRKQAQTAEEKEASDEDDSEIDSEDEPDSEVIYNPKNVPLGWDGKPIPYWLYKLHGLNLTYNCEICGNTTYKGPKAFQLHFAEWRHAHGMRCLGIPNTAHFANITKIEDALKLWNKLKSEKEKEKFHSTTEEFEDSEGRVVNKKTYEDLKKQGLL